MLGQNLIPIMIGVAGHRNYSMHSREALTSGVRSLIAWFRDTNPSTPLAILSSLAEGADQLCAEVALELGARVIVPLPFPPDVYRLSTSFASDEGRETLDRLLKADSVMWSVCPPPRRAAPKDKAGWAALSDEKESRQDCYMGAAAYISVHCHALIALWDGNTSDRPAGTYPLVRFKLTGELPDSHPYSRPAFQWADRGPVFVVHTPRDEGKEGRPLAPRPLGQVRELHPGDDPACFCAGLVWSEGRPPGTKTPRFFAWTDWIKPASVVSDAREEALARRNAERAQFAETCLRLDEFNREIKSFEEDAARCASPRSPESSQAETAPDSEDASEWPSPPSRLSNARVDEGIATLDEVRAAAALLSRKYHRRIEQLTIKLFGLMLLSFLFLESYAHIFEIEGDTPSHHPWLLGIYLGLLTVVLPIVWYVGGGRFERKWLDSRALAEALRVQSSWCRAGVASSVAASYLQQVHSELSWVRHALRACGPPHLACREAFENLPQSEQNAVLEQVCNDWVGGQRKFYEKFEQYHRKEKRMHWAGFGLAFVGWTLAGWMLVKDSRHPWEGYLVLSGISLVAGGLLIDYKDRLFLAELARQYERMHTLFTYAERDIRRLLRCGDIVKVQLILEELGREALSENASWLILHRARPFELPVG